MGIFTLIRALFGLFRLIRIFIANTMYRAFFFLFNLAVFAGIGISLLFSPFLFLALFVIRWAVVFRVDKLMNKWAGDHPDEFLPQVEVQEVPSSTTPTFVTFNANSSISKFAAFREGIVKSAQADLSRRLSRDLLLGLGYFGLMIPSVLLGENLSMLFGAGMFMGGLLLISVFIRWLFLRNQYRPDEIDFKNALMKNPILYYGKEAAALLHKGGTEILAGLMMIFLIVTALSSGEWPSVVLLVIVGGIHTFLLFKSQFKSAHNIKLLVLRTFNINENSLFTFGRLIQYWEHVGNYFTVVDTSFLKHKYRFWSKRTLGVFIAMNIIWWLLYGGLVTIFPAIMSDNSGLPESLYLFIPIFFNVIAMLIVIAFEYYMIGRDFIKSREQFQGRLERLDQKPRGLTNANFKGLPTMCHANTWKATVAEMVKKTDIVLMDLRGFSEKKNGCKDEVNFLLDKLAVDRLLILIGAKDDQVFIRNSILEQWKELKVDSPNLTLADPQIHIYISDAQDEEDVQGIFDHLVGCAMLSGRINSALAN